MKLKHLYRITYFCAFVILHTACTSETASSPTSDSTVAKPTENITLEGWTQKINATPNNPDLYFARANVQYERGAYEAAIKDLQQALQLDSTQVTYYHLLADAYLDNNQSLEAMETMVKAGNRFPTRIPTLLKISEFQIILRKNEDAFRTLEAILQREPQNAEAYFMMGLNFLDIGDQERAKNSFQTAVENNPDLIDAWLELGYLYEKQGNALAARYFDNALRIDATNITALEAKGNYLGGLGKFAEAIEVYKEIHRLDPQNAAAFYNTGLAYLQIDSLPQAYRHFDISVKVDPTYTMGYYYRGQVAAMQGNRQNAQQDFEQALRIDPDFKRAQEALQKLK